MRNLPQGSRRILLLLCSPAILRLNRWNALDVPSVRHNHRLILSFRPSLHSNLGRAVPLLVPSLSGLPRGVTDIRPSHLLHPMDNYVYVNCQSLLPHFSEFSDYFVHSTFDLIAMSETWLKPQISDTLVNLPGYQIIRLDRKGKDGEA